MTVISQILYHSKQNPHKAALITDCGLTITYKELILNISKYAFYLDSRGIVTGDNVVLSATKEVEFVFLYFAIHLLGARAVIVDPESNKQRLNYIIDQTKPSLVFGFGINEMNFISYNQIIVTEIISDIERLVLSIKNTSICDILFTTGTTGNPKGVNLTQSNIMHAVININTYIGTNENDIEALVLPICHSFGLGRLRCVLAQGATLIMLGSFANLKLFFDCLQKYQVTGLGMVPSMWNYIYKFSGKRITQYSSRIRYIEIGSAAMDLNSKKILSDLFPNVRICMHYGLSEASRSAFMEFHEDVLHLDSIGKPAPNVEIEFFSESGEKLPIGFEGELCVKGEHVMCSYFDEVDNINTYYGNYFRTGDWGLKDNERYCYLVGRKKELINVGGKKVSPVEIEECINKMDEVIDNICIGIQDVNGILGEVVKTFVKKKSGSKLDSLQIKSFVRNNLETYKTPSFVEFVDKLPITKSGKKQRLLLH
ncbi:class I adenylate-forming enzyme family protein [uncultured Bacteroides sp.]|uniref:class I adenylate-forming enzyme family protein n=1 Tax=uncultured Bacteroides sp. TaxID=162156 RepID=UPI0026063C71|nr:class I adenylate-forming enzyme family protein [uncultured Bacteroides sp.]